MSYQKLNDETFPASLLIEFDELDDEILISPAKLFDPAHKIPIEHETRSPVTTSHTLNSSSGNYSLSTENENGSGSSSSSNPNPKYRTTTTKRLCVAKDTKIAAKKAPTRNSSSGGQKRAKSMENLLNGAASGRSLAVPFKRQKYGHVKSKVKQFIDEAASQHDRQVFVRHKSMPETGSNRKAEEEEASEQEGNVDVLRSMLKEKDDKLNSLQRHLQFSEIQREDNIIQIQTLKRKIEAMRLEHTQRERERQRERDLDNERHRQKFLTAYLRYQNQHSEARISVGTQTEPEENSPPFSWSTFAFDKSLQRMESQPNSSTVVRAKRSLQFALEDELEGLDENNNQNDKVTPDSATNPENCSSADNGNEAPQLAQEIVTEDTMLDKTIDCKECARRLKKKQKRTRLASLFCIRKAE